MKSIRKMLSNLPKRLVKTYIVAGTVVALLSIAGGIIVKAEFYPNRTPFDYSKPCNSSDNDPYDRCGSLTGPVFNSFINTPSYGDERAFLDARRSDQTAAGSFKNVLTNVTDGSKEVVIRMYVHNNANQTTNATNGIARNTKVRIALPTATSQTLRARGYISADNASPGLVEDTVDMTAGEQFNVEYIPGSATLYNNGPFKNGTALSDSVVTTGAPVGYNALDGNMPGCFEFEAVVQIRIKITPKQNPNIDFSKQVAVPGQAEWGEKVSVKPGDRIKWLISFSNKGQVDLTDVNISDKLPPHLNLTSGSVRYIDAAQDVVQGDTPLFGTGGIDFGTWKPNGGFYVRFETTSKDDFAGCEVTLRNIAYNTTDQTGKGEDSADVTITKPNCQPAVPVFRCDLLTAQAIGNDKRTYRFTVATTAQGGAKVKQYSYDFGDQTQPLVTDKNVVEHTFPAQGDFVTVVTPQFDVNGTTKNATSETCKIVINIKTTPPPTTPPTTTTLVDTGPGDIAGIFTGTSLLGAFLHRKWTMRSKR